MRKQIWSATLVVFTGISGMLFFGRDVNAYIDPSVMTYVIQAVAGVAVAAGAGLGIYIRKARKKLMTSSELMKTGTRKLNQMRLS